MMKCAFMLAVILFLTWQEVSSRPTFRSQGKFNFLISEMKYLVYPSVCRRSYAIWCSLGHWSFSAAIDRLLKLAPNNRIIFKNLFAGRVCVQRKNLFC